jgi:catechol 2,3-dioxygenase
MNFQIDSRTDIGAVSLAVTDLQRSIDFYSGSLGFQVHRQDPSSAALGAGEEELLLLEASAAGRRPSRATGLYHFAILVPSRPELARSLARLADSRARLQGAADHWVSEALYLSDPDGNGIEIYRDRPRAEWPMENGRPQMTTEALDMDGIMAELPDGAIPADLPAGTAIGHVHLQVAEIGASERFYTGALGLDLVLRFGSAAGFVSAGGYHHHIGFNTWAGVGAPRPPADAAGLRWFELRLPDQAALERLLAHLAEAGVRVEEIAGKPGIIDPSGISIRLTTRQGNAG